MSSLITIGRFLKQRGVRGELKIIPLTYSPERFMQLSHIYVKVDQEIKEFEIEYFRSYERTYILKLSNINSREDAVDLVGKEILISEEESPSLPEGVYYHYQIIGLEVYTEDGSHLGRVTEIIETGSNDVYVVREAGAAEDGSEAGSPGKKAREYLIPAISEIVRVVDLDNGVIKIRPVDGLLE
jgi:16S rRNA processing protein RimM